MIIPLRMGEIGLTINSSDTALQNVTLGQLKQTAAESVAEVLSNATIQAVKTNETAIVQVTALNQTMKTIGKQAGVQIVGVVPLATSANISEVELPTTTSVSTTTETPSTTTAATTTAQTTESTAATSTEATTVTTTEATTTITTSEEITTTSTTMRPKTIRLLVAAGVPSTTLRPQTTTILAPMPIEAVRGRQRGSLTRIVSLKPIQDGRQVTVKSQIDLGDKDAVGGKRIFCCKNVEEGFLLTPKKIYSILLARKITGCQLDGQLYSNYQAIPLAELRDPCIVRICKDGVMYGPSMQRCPPAIDGKLSFVVQFYFFLPFLHPVGRPFLQMNWNDCSCRVLANASRRSLLPCLLVPHDS